MNVLRHQSFLSFRGCLKAPRTTSLRCYASLQPALLVHSPAARSIEDDDLRAIFDEPTQYSPTAGLQPTGLFGYSEMSSPSSIVALGDRTLVRARTLVSRAKRANSSSSELRKLVKNMDRLSDMLCIVIDMCELVRYAHPDPEISGAANKVYEYLCSYMNLLNTDVELHENLRLFLTDPEVSASTTYEERQVAKMFQHDFVKSGIHLPDAERKRCVELSDEILVLGRRFLHEASAPRSSYPMPIELLDGMPPAYRQEVISTSNSRWGGKTTRILPHSRAHYLVATYAPNGEARRRAFVAANSSSEQQIAVLERLLKARSDLAGIVGYRSYAHMSLGNTMAQGPEHVMEFLRTLSEHHRPTALANIHALATVKQHELGISSLSSIEPWDRDFYTPFLPSPAKSISLSPYFSLGTVLQGLSRLLSRLYGISLRPSSIAQGEAWHPDVRKLEVVDEDEGTVGYVYVDAWSRAGKSPGAAHYTVRCSRRVDDDDIVGDALDEEPSTMDLALPLQVPSVSMKGKEGRYQLPLIVLMCDVGPANAGGPSLLSWTEVETLFHEMGHAVHSMIGRTDYHNVSGTRCATDFVELPSILMEHLVASPTAIGLFARHHKTGEPLPYAELQKHIAVNNQFEPLNSQHQIMLAALDQVLHGPADERGSSTEEWAKLHGTMGAFPYAEGTSWQTQFGHLFSYGATYYSYLFDRAIASRVFEVVFGGDKGDLNRDMGERFKKDVLSWGGGKEPWEMVGKVLGDEEVMKGGKAAMHAVGRWGIGEEVPIVAP